MGEKKVRGRGGKERISVPILVSVHYTRYQGVDVCGCADEEEDDEEEGLEVEDCCLREYISRISWAMIGGFSGQMDAVRMWSWGKGGGP